MTSDITRIGRLDERRARPDLSVKGALRTRFPVFRSITSWR
jgi:hypothetical protein